MAQQLRATHPPLSRRSFRATLLNKSGQTIDEIYIIGLGDLIECIYGFFDHQPFNIELTRTEQEHLARKIYAQIM